MAQTYIALSWTGVLFCVILNNFVTFFLPKRLIDLRRVSLIKAPYNLMNSLKKFKTNCRSLSIALANIGSLVLGQTLVWSAIEPRIANVTLPSYRTVRT